jgi:hypothetical protein
MTFDQPLAAAPTAADIHLYRRSGDRPNGKGSSHRLPITISSFDAATQTLTLKPRRPLHANRFYQLVASGSAAQSPNGSMLDGSGTGVAGSSFSYYFGSGKELNYVDRDGNRVALILHGPGTIHLVRGSDGEGENVSLTGTTAATELTGWVHPTRMGGSGETTLASIAGLGAATNNLPASMFVIE